MWKTLVLSPCVALVMLGAVPTASADVPPLMNYQGILLDSGGQPITVPVNVVFAIWNADSGGDSLWSEQHGVLPDENGRCSILLGTFSPIPDSAFADDAYLGIKVESDLEMVPRTRLVSVPYTYVSGRSGHCEVCDSCLHCGGDGDWIIDGDNIYHPPGLVGVGTLEPVAKFDVDVPDDETYDPLSVRYHETTRMIVKDDGDVGIGTDGPLHRLDVRGNAGFDEYLFHNQDNDTYLRFSPDQFDIGAGGVLMLTSAVGVDNRVVINDDGSDVNFRVESGTDVSALFVRGSDSRVGLGTNDPQHRLDVRGDAGFDDYLYHNSDPDTYVRFYSDQIDLYGGGVQLLTLDETTQDQVVINEGSADVDFRVESDAGTHALFVRASDGNVGIGTSSPGDALDVNGDITVRGGDFKDAAGVERLSYADGGKLYLKEDDGAVALTITTSGNVGIGTDGPNKLLDVDGQALVRDDMGIIGSATVGDTLYVGGRAWLNNNLEVAGRINQAVFRSGAATSGNPNVAVDMSSNDLDQGEVHFGNTVDDEWVDMWFIYSNGRLMGHFLYASGLDDCKMYRFNLNASGVIGSSGSAGHAYWDAAAHNVVIYEDGATNGQCEWWSYDRRN